MSRETWTPQRAAIRMFRIAEAFSKAHGHPLFPIDVTQLALGAAELFSWKDPIVEVKPAAISSFEGALFAADDRKKWMLLYNDTLKSKGRIRFTQAHELGHYILHRLIRDSFECSQADMLNWSDDVKDLEGQADLFASYLLMPIEDFRAQVTEAVDLDAMGRCADRYGVSMTAAILKWLSYTDQTAVLVMSNDGFINWARSSDPAMKAGAFFRTSTGPIELPRGSLAAEKSIRHSRVGITVPSSTWFPASETGFPVREMKISADQYDSVLTLLVLPRSASAWGPWANK